ncbi:MAG: site-specific integrase, partial [Acidimicrobiia bacterium]|nr:site-specific integrase [Acidimicrobiia bacterium]
LDPVTVAALRAHRIRQAAERLQWGPAWIDSGLVFGRENGAWLHPGSFTQLFDKHVRRAGLSRIRLHDLRHTHASLALQAGVAPKVVSERLGHARVAFTLDTYVHSIPAQGEEAARKVADLVFGASRTPRTG